MSANGYHGTVTGYQAHGCRCDDCRDAQHSYYLRNRDKLLEASRAWYARNRAAALETQRAWRERLKNGEIVLPELDRAVCYRGGSAAQAKAHRRRGEKPCADCLAAETRAAATRRAARTTVAS